MCGLSRYLLPAFAVGLIVATLFGSDLPGWIAAGLTVAVIAGRDRARGGAPACTVTLPPATDETG